MKQSTLADIPIEADIATSSKRSAMASAASMVLVLLTAASCGFPRPPDLVGDAPGGADGSAGPIVAIHVSPSGDDANDGMTQPVKTLKHAIGLAIENSQISMITLASGRYSSDSGETFPYMVPAKMMIAGPAGGGAILAGNMTETALVLREALLQDVEFEGFGLAIDSIGAATLNGIRIRESMIAIHGHVDANLMIDNLDITGVISACASGIVLNDTAALKVAALATRNLGVTLDSEDHSTSDLTNVNITGDPGCPGSVINVVSDKTLSFHEGLLEDGNIGISLGSLTSGGDPSQASLVDVTIHGMKTGIGIGHASLSMVGGEFARCGMTNAAISSFRATLSLGNVTFTQNVGLAMFAQDTQLTMRECSVTATSGGLDISVADPSVTDLGTSTDPGKNTFQGGLVIEGSDFSPLRVIDAIGNTWNPSVQGADGNGQYDPTLVIPGSSTGISGPNYSLSGNMVALRL